MQITVYVSEPKKGLYFWENIHNAEDIKEFFRRLKDPHHYSWVKDKKWGNKKLKKLLEFLLEMNVYTCSLNIYPYKYEIRVHVKGPNDPGGGGLTTAMAYQESELPEQIAGRIAHVVSNYWKARINSLVNTAKSDLAECKKYLG